MTETFRKLNFKSQDPILVPAAPGAFEKDLREMEGTTGVHRSPAAGARYQFALAFAPMKADLVRHARSLLKSTDDAAVLWFAYPKQTSKEYTSDLNRDLCWSSRATAPIP